MFRYIAILFLLSSCASGTQPERFIPVAEARDNLLARILQHVPAERLDGLDNDFVMNFITDEEKRVFANNHWNFTVDRPAIVSVMRHAEQETVPFWLMEKGFVNTGKTVKNQQYEYELWQKRFPAGKIQLGINGFDLHRVVYFVSIGPAEKGGALNITDVYPANWPIIEMRKGAYLYNDWTELTVVEMPDELEGHTLFTTVRGRARDASVVNSFRTTEFPSSPTPDQIVLTWDGDPTTTQAVQWRTDTTVSDGYVRYWKRGDSESEAREKPATFIRLKDAYIYNDMEVNRWGVTIDGLTPGTRYDYRVGSRQRNTSSETFSFRTAPAGAEPFKFIYLGDTHNADIVKTVMEHAFQAAPDAAFMTVTGDHVNTGLFREQWEKYIALGKEVFASMSFAPVLGNHDSQDGLPPVLYAQLFRLPEVTSCNLTAGHNFAFSYSNARFFSLDVTGGKTNEVACWLEEELKNTTEEWKIVMMHFSPYVTDDAYLGLRQRWCSLFDKYQVDLVLTGHVHQYFRSFPLYNNKPVVPPARGAVYVSSMAVETREGRSAPSARYNEVFSNQGCLYQIIEINRNKLDFLSKSIDGQVVDRFQIIKP